MTVGVSYKFMKSNNELKLLIGGEGGQGVQSLGKIISEAAFEKNLQVTFIPNYGIEQRGGLTLAFIKFRKTKPIVYPKFSKADILVWLSDRAVKRTEQYLGKDTMVIYNKGFVHHLKNKDYLAIDFDKLGTAIGSNRVINMLMLGVLFNPGLKINLGQWLNFEKIKNSINQKFAKYYKKNPHLKELNEQALNKGYQLKI